jgi:hypothetical protein
MPILARVTGGGTPLRRLVRERGVDANNRDSPRERATETLNLTVSVAIFDSSNCLL